MMIALFSVIGMMIILNATRTALSVLSFPSHWCRLDPLHDSPYVDILTENRFRIWQFRLCVRTDMDFMLLRL